MFEGVGRCHHWPDEPGSYNEDDYLLAPRLGLAVLSRGSGAIGMQGKPASILALWSLLGELQNGLEHDPARCVHGAFERADEAVGRLSYGWPPGLAAPWATLALLRVQGSTVTIYSVGDCRIYRSRAGQLERLVGHAPDVTTLALLLRGQWRALGCGVPVVVDEHTFDTQPDDTFLLAPPSLLRYFTPDQLAALMAADDLHAAVDEQLGQLASRHPYGETSLCVLRLGPGTSTEPVSGSVCPPTSWLFNPGQPLPDPPRTYDGGPDEAWFREVFRPIVGAK